MIGEELGLIEHPLQNLFEPVLANQRQQQALIFTSLAHGGDVALCHVVAVLNEPLHPTFEIGEFVDELRFESQDRIQGDKADQGPYGHLLRPRPTPGDRIVVEAVFIVPQTRLLSARPESHGVGYQDEMLKEFGCNVFVGTSVFRQLQRYVEHAKAVESHPPRTVGLLQNTTSRQGLGAVEQTDVVQTQETTLENVLAIEVFAVHPPRKVEQQFLEYTFEKVEILSAVHFSFNLESPED